MLRAGYVLVTLKRNRCPTLFMDVESIDAGIFETVILNQIAARPHFIVILTPGSVERFSEPGDWLRREIEQAITHERNIVPILANDFAFATYPTAFTGALAALPGYNALPLYHEYFDEAMARLRRRFLNKRATGTLRPTPPDEQPIVQRKIETTANQPAPTNAQLTAEELFVRSLEHFGKHHYHAAITTLNACLDLYPAYAPAYVVRGSAHGHVDDLPQAIADLERYLALRDDDQYMPRPAVAQMIFTLKKRLWADGE